MANKLVYILRSTQCLEMSTESRNVSECAREFEKSLCSFHTFERFRDSSLRMQNRNVLTEKDVKWRIRSFLFDTDYLLKKFAYSKENF